jgi:signal transduction histidine kinase/ActR/RegA family two-component response regulator
VNSESMSASKTRDSNPSRFRIAGIGASTHGLESLKQFLKELPPNPGMAFIVIQHLPAHFHRVMDELLVGLDSNLPIQQAEHNIEIQPNRIYLLPPGKAMTIRDRRLLLRDNERVTGLTLPIDQFFLSLARDAGPEAIGILLSGTGPDGSRGAQEIKKMGGRVFESAHTSDIARLVIEDSNPTESLQSTIETLQASNKELHRRNEELARGREQFLAMLSHELRNPLAAVVNAAMVMQAPNVKSESIEKARQIIGRQSRHMARLLDDLLELSQITRGGVDLRKEDVDLRDVVRNAIEVLTPVLEEHNAKLTTDLPLANLLVRADAARMQQVVVNLVSNAARYSPPGSPIHLSATVNADSVVLKVQDHGRGISSSIISEIFDLFVQDGQGLERSAGGLGIGLTFVRRIVELHGGQVEAFSDGHGKGSEFIVTLPRQAKAVIRPQPEPQRSSDVQRVLVVEDQDDSREMLRVLLESMGHIVLERANGATGLAAIEQDHPDVALIDIGLPVMSGYEVARRVRANPRLHDVILVALTGYGRDSDVATAKAAGFDEHVTKPADLHVIEEILSRKIPRRKAS